MIRIGIICPSEIAFRRFLPSLQKAEGFEYVGVAIANKEEFVGATDEVLAKERAKAQTFVYLPLPPALHFQWAKQALQKGKHVLVEKPSTISLADTQELISIAKEKSLALHENYMFVFHNQIAAINEIVKSGEIGDIRLYRISFGFPRRDARDFRYNKALGGGALLDAGGYTMKLATELLGSSVRLVAATANYTSEFEVDIYGSATLENDDKVVAQVAFGMDNDYKCDLEIWGSKGTLTTGRIMTAPNGFEPTYTIKKNQEYTDGKLPADDAVCKDNYEKLLKQEQLVEAFKNLSKMQ